ncbi:MAG TPA: hypothetical protein VJ302_14175, partial [Blastocatellia bacterium]|nr:hypothetical protein [Blastocatellia bacterium]
NADLNEPVTITRAADGALRIEALTETAERKAEILAALQPVINHPAVRVEVETVAEAMRKRRPEAAPAAGRVLDQRMAPASNALPVDQELRRYLARAEDRARFGSEIESALQRFALQVLNRASATANHARALERLARRFSPDQSQALTPSVREKWRALVFTHAQTVGQETAVLRRLLQPVFFATAAPEPEGKPLAAVTDDASLATAVRQLSELSAAVEKAINEAFTLSNEKAAATAVREPQFLSTLEQIERSAAIIQNYSRSEDSNREIRGIR